MNLNCIYPLKWTYMYNTVFFVLYAEQQLNCLCGELFTSECFSVYSEGPLIVFRRDGKFSEDFTLCVRNK